MLMVTQLPMTQFRHFSENLTHYGLECPQCKRVLNVDRSRVFANGADLRISPPLTCKCGAAGESAFRTTPTEHSAVVAEPPRAKNDAKEWLALFAVVGFALLLCFGFYSCDKASAERDAQYHKRIGEEQDANQAILRDAIKQHRIIIGMTRTQVIASWGKPDDINRTITEGHVSEQLIYPNSKYAYVDNGVLTAIQD